MCEVINRPADRQFCRRCLMGVGFSLAVYVACSQTALRMHDSPLTLALAGISGAAFFAELVIVGLLVTRIRDEFQRILLSRSFLWGTLITMGFTTIWGFIELHMHNGVPHLELIWIPIILIGMTAGVKLLIFRQYRPGSE